MRRLLLRIAPLALIAVPVHQYARRHEQVAAAYELRAHTYEAAALAERVAYLARPAGPVSPGELRAAVLAFADKTADNPVQVAAARDMLRILPDCPAPCGPIADLAGRAVAEERRLLPIRSADAAARLHAADAWTRILVLAGLLTLAVQAVLEWLARRNLPTVAQLLAERALKDRAIADLETVKAQVESMLFDEANSNRYLRSMLDVFRERYRDEVGHEKRLQMIDDVKSLHDAVGGGEGAGDAPPR